MMFFTIFHEITKLRRFEWLNCLDVSDAIYTNERT